MVAGSSGCKPLVKLTQRSGDKKACKLYLNRNCANFHGATRQFWTCICGHVTRTVTQALIPRWRPRSKQLGTLQNSLHARRRKRRRTTGADWGCLHGFPAYTNHNGLPNYIGECAEAIGISSYLPMCVCVCNLQSLISRTLDAECRETSADTLAAQRPGAT